MYRASGSMQQVMQENSWSEFSKIITKCFLPISPVIEAVDALEDNVSAAFSFYIIGKFDIRRTLDKKSPHKSGHRKQTID